MWAQFAEGFCRVESSFSSCSQRQKIKNIDEIKLIITFQSLKPTLAPTQSVVSEKKGELSEYMKQLCLERVNKHKPNIAIQFIEIAQQLEKCLPWKFFDYVDPASGVLMNQDNPNRVYFETLGIDHFLKHYKSVQIGMCRVTDHPKFGLDCYPASIFVSAVQEREVELVLRELVKSYLNS